MSTARWDGPYSHGDKAVAAVVVETTRKINVRKGLRRDPGVCHPWTGEKEQPGHGSNNNLWGNCKCLEWVITEVIEAPSADNLCEHWFAEYCAEILHPKSISGREGAENRVNSPGIRKNWGSPSTGEVPSHRRWQSPPRVPCTSHSARSAALSSKVLMNQTQLTRGKLVSLPSVEIPPPDSHWWTLPCSSLLCVCPKCWIFWT